MDKLMHMEQALAQKRIIDFFDLVNGLKVQDILDILAAADIHLNEAKLKAMYEENYDSNAMIEYFQDIYAEKEEQLCYVNALLDGDIFSFLIHRLIHSYYDPCHLSDPLLLFSYMQDVFLGVTDCTLADMIQWINNVDGIKAYNDCTDLDGIFGEVHYLNPMEMLVELVDPYELTDEDLPLAWDFFTAVEQLCHDFDFVKEDELMDIAALMIILYDPDYQEKVLDKVEHEGYKRLKPYIHLVDLMYQRGQIVESRRLALTIQWLKADDIVAKYDIPKLLDIFKSA